MHFYQNKSSFIFYLEISRRKKVLNKKLAGHISLLTERWNWETFKKRKILHISCLRESAAAMCFLLKKKKRTKKNVKKKLGSFGAEKAINDCEFAQIDQKPLLCATLRELNQRGNIWTGCKEHGDFPSAVHMAQRALLRTAGAFHTPGRLFSTTFKKRHNKPFSCFVLL